MTHIPHGLIPRWEAAYLLGVPTAVIDRAIETGLLAAYLRHGRYVCVIRRQVEELSRLPPEWIERA